VDWRKVHHFTTALPGAEPAENKRPLDVTGHVSRVNPSPLLIDADGTTRKSIRTIPIAIGLRRISPALFATEFPRRRSSSRIRRKDEDRWGKKITLG